MEEIYNTTDQFHFRDLKLHNPTSVNGGNYFLKFSIQSHPLYIQSPKCKTRNGFVKSGKKMQCELMFTNEDEEFIRWMENLEQHCYQCIYDNRKEWFTMDMEMYDIENYFVSPLKIYKSGKFYLLKVNVSSTLGKTSLKIYDENETPLEMETIQENTNVITILEIQSVKCSAKSFQIEVELKQMMVLHPTNLFEKCLIKSKQNPSLTDSATLVTEEEPSNPNIVMSKDEPLSNTIALSSSLSESTSISTPLGNPLMDSSSLLTNYTHSETGDSTQGEKRRKVDEDPTDLETIQEIELDLEQIPETDSFQIKHRNDIYYKIYLEAKQKAKLAKDLALSAYLEVKRIKNAYMLEDSDESDMEAESDAFSSKS
jgi:hypothetical protein